MARGVHSKSNDGHIYTVYYPKSQEDHRRSRKKCKWYNKSNDTCIHEKRMCLQCVVRFCTQYEERQP